MKIVLSGKVNGSWATHLSIVSRKYIKSYVGYLVKAEYLIWENSKHQITNNIQIRMTNDPNKFGICFIVILDLVE